MSRQPAAAAAPAASAARPALTATAEIHDGFLRVIEAAHHADFHLRWLRHNCDLDRHPATGERLIDSAMLPDQLAVSEATIDDGVLRVRWAHDHRVSRFPLAWLRRHAYAVDRAAAPRPPSDIRTLELDGGPGAAAVIGDVLARVDRHGAVVVRRDYPTPEAETEAWIAALEARGLGVVTSHFGRIEELRPDNRTNAHTDQLGSTDAAIDLHTDQPFLAEPPRYQLLHAIRRADHGGETLLADGAAAFTYLASQDAEAADVLQRTPVCFHRRQHTFDRETISPIVSWRDGRLRVRASSGTLAPFQLAFDRMAAWYRAYDAFVRLVRDPAHHFRFTLHPGDVLLYDNHRMLHGRTQFRGPRWSRGVYFDNHAARQAIDRSDLDASG